MSFGPLWAPFGHPLCSLWAPLRSLWPPLGGSWTTLGALWDHFAPPEGYLEGLWCFFWVCWGYFAQCFVMLEIFFIYFSDVFVLTTCLVTRNPGLQPLSNLSVILGSKHKAIKIFTIVCNTALPTMRHACRQQRRSKGEVQVQT